MNARDRKKKLSDIRLVADSLRSEPIEAPDLTASILDRVDAQRAFLAPSVRARIPWLRLGVLGGLSVLGLSCMLVLRYAPESVRLVERPAPLTAVVDRVEQAVVQVGSAAPMTALRQTVETVSLAEPVSVLSVVASPVEPVAPAAGVPALAGGGGEPAFVGPVLPLGRAVEIAAVRAAAIQDEPVMAGGPAVLPGTAVLMSARPLLGGRLESSTVSVPRAGWMGGLPGMLGVGTDESLSIK
jgi:hypothetical protein